jgi:hypothetical protein
MSADILYVIINLFIQILPCGSYSPYTPIMG